MLNPLSNIQTLNKTSKGAEAANYPFCTIEPNVGIVEVPDLKLKVLTDINASEKVRQDKAVKFQRNKCVNSDDRND